MKDKCCICGQYIEPLKGCYITPSGVYCILCYETNDVMKYVLKIRGE